MNTLLLSDVKPAYLFLKREAVDSVNKSLNDSGIQGKAMIMDLHDEELYQLNDREQKIIA